MFMAVNKIIFLFFSVLYLDSKVFALRRIFYEPSVPRPRQYHRGSEKRHSIYGRLFTRRVNMATQAGYTNNVDTCKLYNDNLAEVWTVLSKFIAPDQETPDNMALHNIILLVKAYTDHHSLVKNDENIQPENDTTNSRSVPETLNDIKVMLEERTPDKDEEMPSKIIAVIKTYIKTSKGKIYEKCYESNEEKLKVNVYKEYQRYIEFPNCRRFNKSGRVSKFEKMSTNDAKRFLRQWEKDPETDCRTVARNMFLETIKAIINGYIVDLKCRID